MSDPKEKKRPAIAEGYIPSWSNSPESQFTSHETACLLNTRMKTRTWRSPPTSRTGSRWVLITLPFRSSAHFNELEDPDPIPPGTDYASVIESDIPIVVQHTRLDSPQAENALLSTVAYASND